MTPFQTAVEIVQSALKDFRAGNVEMCASAEVVARLTAPVAKQPAVTQPASDPIVSPKDEPHAQRQTGTSDRATKVARLDALRARVLPCVKCPHLAASRTQVVFGVGNPEAELMFVGEAPGADEDLAGEPFVGKAGQLLTKIIETMGFTREQIFIANVLKCRPNMPPGEPGNRKPTVAEMQTCLPYLAEQIEIVQPRSIVALGATAMEGLLGETQPMARLRGRWHDFRSIPLMATYHPAYLLRNQAPGEKRKVWEDMLLVLERLGRPITERQRKYFLAK
jgi:DNA polymerase